MFKNPSPKILPQKQVPNAQLPLLIRPSLRVTVYVLGFITNSSRHMRRARNVYVCSELQVLHIAFSSAIGRSKNPWGG